MIYSQLFKSMDISHTTVVLGWVPRHLRGTVAWHTPGNGFSLILNFRLPDVQLVISWSVAEVTQLHQWFKSSS